MNLALFYFVLEHIICIFFTAILCSMIHSDKIKINDEVKEFFVFLASFSLFNHILFMLILINDFLNFNEIMNWMFEIGISIFGCENRAVEELFRLGT